MRDIYTCKDIKTGRLVTLHPNAIRCQRNRSGAIVWIPSIAVFIDRDGGDYTDVTTIDVRGPVYTKKTDADAVAAYHAKMWLDSGGPSLEQYY